MKRNFGRAIALCLFLACSAAATAQMGYSDSFTFLKAVRERDGVKVQELVSRPGSIVINTRERQGEGALHIVTRDRDLSWLNFLLSRGARPDLQTAQGVTALHLAATLGWVDGADLLLRRRASVDLSNQRGETALILAVQRRDMAMVRLLTTSGANPRRADSVAGMSALDYAKQDPRGANIARMLEAARPSAPRPATPAPKAAPVL